MGSLRTGIVGLLALHPSSILGPVALFRYLKCEQELREHKTNRDDIHPAVCCCYYPALKHTRRELSVMKDRPGCQVARITDPLEPWMWDEVGRIGKPRYSLARVFPAPPNLPDLIQQLEKKKGYYHKSSRLCCFVHQLYLSRNIAFTSYWITLSPPRATNRLQLKPPSEVRFQGSFVSHSPARDPTGFPKARTGRRPDSAMLSTS
ncbi:hypothetical protein F5144DRAFT_124722 [Chaetomium tenue]|uniref:Uncharacterized protein n=1 Tax=Chaetomium tenue TaxID=1854479 RepID=A0ACB7PLD1_9PEZI|nr:hypothetical protein F5144DRAFT_124722 [Chaetomium globosum]